MRTFRALPDLLHSLKSLYEIFEIEIVVTPRYKWYMCKPDGPYVEILPEEKARETQETQCDKQSFFFGLNPLTLHCSHCACFRIDYL